MQTKNGRKSRCPTKILFYTTSIYDEEGNDGSGQFLDVNPFIKLNDSGERKRESLTFNAVIQFINFLI